MRKFTLLAALFLSVMGANAQNIVLVRNGEVLQDGAKIEVTDVAFDEDGMGLMDAHIYVMNNSAEDLNATLSVSVKEGDPFSFCSFGESQCVSIVAGGDPVVRNCMLKAGEEVNPEIHSISPIMADDPEASFYSVVEYKLLDGFSSTAVLVTFNYVNSSSISNVYGDADLYVADNALQYSFGDAANRSLNVYSITGAKVMSETLETAGTIGLNNLGKGVYLYEILENGKRVAAHKCVIR